MIKPLRKRHLQVWSLMAIVLPAGFLFSWLVIPNQQPVQLLNAPVITPLPVIEHTIELPAYTVRLRTDARKEIRQLEWVNREELTVPSAVIYQSGDSAFHPSAATLVGRIEAKGSYLFPLAAADGSPEANHFILYDFIHQQVIDHLNFTP